MKKLIPILLLVGTTLLCGCGDTNDFNTATGQQGHGTMIVVMPAPVARADTYTATAG